jgi:MscS family membrane protein
VTISASIQQISNDLLQYYHQNAWMLHVFLVILSTGILNFVKNRIYLKWLNKISRGSHLWHHCFLETSQRPLSMMFWVIGLSFSAQIISVNTHHTLVSKFIITGKTVLLMIALIWFLINFIKHLEDALIKRSDETPDHLDKTTVRAISQLFRIAVIISSALILLDTFGVPTSGVMAAGGLGGIAVGFAAKDLLANIFGGLIIFLDRPFIIGEWIRSPEKNLEGVVEHIGWRTTQLRTFDKRVLTIPNGVFSMISIENPSRMSHRRIKTKVGIRYDDATKIKPMLTAMEKMLEDHDAIDSTMTCFVNLTEFGDSSLNFLIYCFTKTTNWVAFQAIQQDVFLRVIDIIDEFEAECAFPTSTLHVPGALVHRIMQEEGA